MNVQFIREVGVYNWISKMLKRQFFKRILKKDHTMALPSGQVFTLPKESLFATEVFITNANVDWGSEALLYKLLKTRGAFLDIGANIGYYSLYMLNRVKEVYSFEPDPRILLLLRRITSDEASLTIVPKAVGKIDGTARFVLEKAGEVSHLALDSSESQDVIEVTLTTIDSFVEENQLQIEAIKIDVEGFDIDAIKGASETLKRQRPIVLTESEPVEELLAMMNELDYKVFAFIRKLGTRSVEFKRVLGAVPLGFSSKMLFLVPAEMEHETLKQAAL